MTKNQYCIDLAYSSNNVVSKNNITANNQYGHGSGIWLYSSNHNIVSSNDITANNGGILLNSSSNNNVFGNNLTTNGYGIILESSSGNTIFHNDFFGNTRQAEVLNSNNSWDDSYPSGGNYWSNYSCVDQKCGPYQNLTGSDGIGDTPYTIDANNTDHYPLMRPWVSFDGQTIYIRADGNVDPSGAPLARRGELYTLTSNVTSKADGIIIERNNITLDATDYTIHGAGNSTGIQLSAVTNVTVRNARVTGFEYGIWLYWSSGNEIADNLVAGNYYGIWVWPSSSGNGVDGNIATGNSGAGIFVGPASADNDLSGNNVTANSYNGIWIQNDWATVVYGNAVAKNGFRGIFLQNAWSSVLNENNVTDNGEGIVIIDSLNITLTRNIMLGNGDNFGVFGDTVDYAVQNIDTSNTVDGKPIYYWINKANQVVPQDAGYVGIVNSTGIRVEGLTMSHNDQGILVAFSANTTVIGNTLTDNVYGVSLVGATANKIVNNTGEGNDYGIGLRYSSGNSLSENSFSNGSSGILLTYSCNNNSISMNDLRRNYASGIDLTDAAFNSISQNNITMNQYGLWLDSAFNNVIYHNNFIDNTQQVAVYSKSTNTWDDGYPSGGNYWSDYTGVDTKNGPYQNLTGGDGIGDFPYVVYTNNTDHYPLMGTFYNFSVNLSVPPFNVTVISNSTITGFAYGIPLEIPERVFISFSVTGKQGSTGFCRVSIPGALMHGTHAFQVFVNDTEIPYSLLPCSNATVSYLYFTYKQSTERVIIVPEFPFFLILPLLMIITQLGAIILKKKRNDVSR
jgi:parallel beta-helix repeat protein